MNVNFLSNPRRFLIVLAAAAILAMTASSASIWLDELVGTSLTPQVYACQHTGGHCG